MKTLNSFFSKAANFKIDPYCSQQLLFPGPFCSQQTLVSDPYCTKQTIYYARFQDKSKICTETIQENHKIQINYLTEFFCKTACLPALQHVDSYPSNSFVIDDILLGIAYRCSAVI